MNVHEAGWRRFKIGDFTATIVSDGAIVFESVASEFPAQQASEVNALLDPSSSGSSPLNCLLLDTGRRLILIDAGMGSSTLLGDGAGRLVSNLAAAGISPDELDAVLLTHLHCDHLWGLIDARGAPVFANAEVFLPKAEFAFWTGEPNVDRSALIAADDIAMTRRCLAAYQARLSLFEGEAELVPGIRAIATPGHTLAHTSYLIASAGERVLNIGDICHHGAVQFARPDWLFRWDDDAELAALSRRRMFDMAADEHIPIVGFHLPIPGVGWVEREGAGFRFRAAARGAEGDGSFFVVE